MPVTRTVINCVFMLVLLLCSVPAANAQRVFVNVSSGFRELTGGAGSCSETVLNNECVPQFANTPFSMAVYKDTIYYIDGTILRSFKIGVPGSCRTYTGVGSFNAMTVDANGILYFSSNQLIRYNPYTNQLTNLGTMPFSSGGDLIFFNGKLLLAGIPAGIYEIDINNPAASTLYMNTNGITFFGLVSFPVPCANSRYFGLAPSGGGNTTMYELDLLNKTVLGTTCILNGLNVFDAGSTTEGGINAGITITSLQVTQPCPPATTGSISIQGLLAGYTTTYTLDNTIVNTTGVFNNVPPGVHTIRLEANTCITDTVITIAPGLNPVIPIQKADVNNCDGNNGSVTLTASSPYQPVLYTLLATGQQQASGTFNNLTPGTYQFNIRDASGCSKDTSVTLLQLPPAFVQGATVEPDRCGAGNGSVKLLIAGGDTTGVQTSLSGAPFLPKVSYYNLPQGVYNLQARRGSICFFDTTIVIAALTDPKPALSLQVSNQFCFTNNGSINIAAAATGFTFQYSISNGSYGSSGIFTNLASGIYPISIRNQYGCSWDTQAVVLPYLKVPVALTVTAVDPVCTEPFSGTLRVSVAGAGGPYRLSINGRQYSNGQLITGLTEGLYNIKVLNPDGCEMDSASKALVIKYEPRCNSVFVPNSFTPNGDGRNDLFRPAYSSFIKDLRMQVFNRYGQRVYEGMGFGVQWDGTFKGAPQSADAYVYWITYTDYFGEAKRMKGSLVLIR